MLIQVHADACRWEYMPCGGGLSTRGIREYSGLSTSQCWSYVSPSWTHRYSRTHYRFAVQSANRRSDSKHTIHNLAIYVRSTGRSTLGPLKGRTGSARHSPWCMPRFAINAACFNVQNEESVIQVQFGVAKSEGSSSVHTEPLRSPKKHIDAVSKINIQPSCGRFGPLASEDSAPLGPLKGRTGSARHFPWCMPRFAINAACFNVQNEE